MHTHGHTDIHTDTHIRRHTHIAICTYVYVVRATCVILPKNWSSAPIGLVSRTTVCMWQSISLYSPQHWAHGTILKSVCERGGGGGLIYFEQIKYTSLHVEMHKFICNHDAYDVVIEKVVVCYHSLMRFFNLYS